MTLDKKLLKRYYTDLNDISVYRWDKLHETNDYIWICKDNYKPDAKAVAVYMHLLYQFDELNLDNLRERRDMVLQIIEILKNIDVKDITIQELRPLNLFLQSLMIDPLSVDLDTVSKFIRNPDIRVELSFLKLEQKGLENRNPSKTNSIYDRVVQISKIIPGMQIDIKKMSIVQFTAYEREALKTIKNGRG